MNKGKLLLLLLLIVLLSAGFIFYINFMGPGGNKETERFLVKQGNVFENEVVDDLVSKGFLKNKEIFYAILSIKGWQNKIEPGAYLISKSMNAYELAKVMVSTPYQRWVVVVPGKRKEQIALILQNSLKWTDKTAFDFIAVAEEGYLSPDTYLINSDADASSVFLKLKSNFNEKFTAQMQKDLLDQNVRTDTALKIASLIERESGGDEDKPIIAGIIWNRLNKGMRLEIDATVQYAVATRDCKLDSDQPEIRDCTFWSRLLPGVVRTVDSPYNTYLNDGLIPGPISSPSLASLKAAIYPAATDAFYYLHSADKQIHTAVTYKEHLQNIEKYLN